MSRKLTRYTILARVSPPDAPETWEELGTTEARNAEAAMRNTVVNDQDLAGANVEFVVIPTRSFARFSVEVARSVTVNVRPLSPTR